VVAGRNSGSSGPANRNGIAVVGGKLTVTVLLVTVMRGGDEWRPASLRRESLVDLKESRAEAGLET
jgi:hypothetical protein